MTTSAITLEDVPYIAHLYDRTGTFKNTFSVLNRPKLRYNLNGGGEAIVLDLQAKQAGSAAAAAGDLIKLTQQFSGKPRIVVARKSSNQTGSAPLTGFLRNDGFDVTELLAATVADCRAFDVVVIDGSAWSAGEHTAFVQSLWNDGQRIIVAGNDTTATDMFYTLTGAAASPVGVTNITATTHPIALGVGALETDADGGNHIRSVVAGAVKLADFTGDSAGFSIIEYAHSTSGGNLIHLQSAGTTDGTHWSILRKNVVNYLNKQRRAEVLYTGLVENLPEILDVTLTHQIALTPLVVECGDTPFNHNYSAATDIGQMVRDAVAQTAHCTATTTTAPDTGITGIFNFQSTNVLAALEIARQVGGPNYYFFVDELGQVWFGLLNTGVVPQYTARRGVDYSVRKLDLPIDTQKNIVQVNGAILPNTTAKLTVTYDQSGSSTIGKRALIPPLEYPNVTDLTTLTNISNTVGALLNQQPVEVQLELPAFGTRLHLARATGTTVRYQEMGSEPLTQSDVGPGTFSPNYPLISIEWDGGKQTAIIGTLHYTEADLRYEIERMIQRTSQSAVSSIFPITPGQIINATTGGPNSPATTAWVFAQWSTGIDNIAQANNAYIIVKWTPNAAADNVTRYEIRMSKNADGNYTFFSVVGGTLDGGGRGFFKIPGLAPNTSYTFEIRAYNSLGAVSAWSATQAQVSGSDSTAPAVPTGLVAAPIPRGALVTWNANTEGDVQGYKLQVSVGGAAYASCTPGPGLSTVMVYVAPSGTPYGTTLQFKIQAVDWSGNASALSAASVSITTDPVRNPDIFAGAITAEKLSAVIVLASLIRGGAGVAHTEMDANGFRAYDANNNIVINIPNDGNPVTLLAQVIASSLAVTGNAIFQGTKNELALGAALQLDSSQSNPTIAPSLASTWDSISSPVASPYDGTPWSRWSLCYDSAGGASGVTKVFWQIAYNSQSTNWTVLELLASNRNVNRNINYGAGSTQVFSVCRLGSNLYVLAFNTILNVFFIDRYVASTLVTDAFYSTNGGTLDMPVAYWAGSFPSLSSDGTNIYIVDQANTTEIKWNKYDAGMVKQGSTISTGYFPTVKASSHTAGNADIGAFRIFTAHHNGEVHSFDSTGAHQANEAFSFPSSSWDSGITYGDALGDGARFWTQTFQAGNSIVKHSTWTWTTASSIYWVGYSWYDDVGTVHETTVGPRTSITLSRRQRLIVTAQSIPGAGGVDDPDKIRFYMLPNATDPGVGGLKLQATQAASTLTLDGYASGGAADPASNGFPAGGPATLASQATGFTYKGSGLRNYTGTVFPASPSTNDHYRRSDIGLEFFYDGTRWVSSAIFEHMLALDRNTTVNTSAVSPAPSLPNAGGSDFWLVDYVIQTFTLATVNGSNYWNLGLQKTNSANAQTNIDTSLTTSADSASVWAAHKVAIGALLFNGTTYYNLFLNLTKTGTPGQLFYNAYLTYRLVAT